MKQEESNALWTQILQVDGTQTWPTIVPPHIHIVVMSFFYHVCPIIWASKMQTEISLSTTEVEYISLSQEMCDVIPFINFITEINELYGLQKHKPLVCCKLFEDNNGAIELANTPNYHLRMKHIRLKYHHFRDQVDQGKVEILPIDSKFQIAYLFTKPLD